MTGQANFLHALGWAVLNSLWQLALLWVVYQLFTAIFRSPKPAAKSRLASALLIAGFAWFIFTFFSALGSSTATAWFGPGTGNAGISVASILEDILPVASTLYLLMLVIPLLRFIKNYRYVQVIRRYGLSKPSVEWRIFVRNIAARMGIHQPVHIWISEWVSSPVTIGFLKPIILVPLAAINNLGTTQMEAVLLHELAHIRRYDYLLNLILNFIRAILYFNPFVKAFINIVESEREKSCDDLVLQFQYDSHQYASALLSLEKLSREHQLLILAAGGGRDLLNRVETIMGIKQRQKFSFAQVRTIVTAFICILTINAILLLNKPIHKIIPPMAGISAPASLAEPVPEDNNLPAEGIHRVSNKVSTAAVKTTTRSNTSIPIAASFISAAGNPEIINASYEAEEVVELDKQEEVQVKEAVEVSRKVLENEQWKSVEKSLADVFSQQEKETLKLALKDEMNKFDWQQWENKLRQAYDKVDWDNVNSQLHNAVNRMKTDSLVKVYNEALVCINQAQKELNSLCLKGFPDTDISLKSLTEKQRFLQKAVNNLKATRTRKIVHL